jgi:hypothetical protein
MNIQEWISVIEEVFIIKGKNSDRCRSILDDVLDGRKPGSRNFGQIALRLEMAEDDHYVKLVFNEVRKLRYSWIRKYLNMDGDKTKALGETYFFTAWAFATYGFTGKLSRKEKIILNKYITEFLTKDGFSILMKLVEMGPAETIPRRFPLESDFLKVKKVQIVTKRDKEHYENVYKRRKEFFYNLINQPSFLVLPKKQKIGDDIYELKEYGFIYIRDCHKIVHKKGVEKICSDLRISKGCFYDIWYCKSKKRAFIEGLGGMLWELCIDTKGNLQQKESKYSFDNNHPIYS